MACCPNIPLVVPLDGTIPVLKNLLIMESSIGASLLKHSNNNHVGMGSSTENL